MWALWLRCETWASVVQAGALHTLFFGRNVSQMFEELEVKRSVIIHHVKSDTANHHLRGKGERNGVQRRTKVSFNRTMMQALERLQLAKRHVSRRSDVEQRRNQAYSYSHV